MVLMGVTKRSKKKHNYNSTGGSELHFGLQFLWRLQYPKCLWKHPQNLLIDLQSKHFRIFKNILVPICLPGNLFSFILWFHTRSARFLDFFLWSSCNLAYWSMWKTDLSLSTVECLFLILESLGWKSVCVLYSTLESEMEAQRMKLFSRFYSSFSVADSNSLWTEWIKS